MKNSEKLKRNCRIWQMEVTMKDSITRNQQAEVVSPQTLTSTWMLNNCQWSRVVEAFMLKTSQMHTFLITPTRPVVQGWSWARQPIWATKAWRRICIIAILIKVSTSVAMSAPTITSHSHLLLRHSSKTIRRTRITTRWLVRKVGHRSRRRTITTICTWAHIARTQILNECLVSLKLRIRQFYNNRKTT